MDRRNIGLWGRHGGWAARVFLLLALTPLVGCGGGAATPSLIVPGNGDGTFGSGTLYDAGNTPIALRVADLNRDGRPDVISIDSLINGVQCLLHR